MNNKKLFEEKSYELLNEILKWIKASNFNNVKKLLESSLNTDAKKSVYFLSDGRSRAEIVKTGVASAGAISSYWNDWEQMGIGESVSVRGSGERFRRSFNPENFGIDISKKIKSLGGIN